MDLFCVCVCVCVYECACCVDVRYLRGITLECGTVLLPQRLGGVGKLVLLSARMAALLVLADRLEEVSLADHMGRGTLPSHLGRRHQRLAFLGLVRDDVLGDDMSRQQTQ